MKLNIRAGMRILYKQNGSNWLIGEISSGTASINENGLYLPICAEHELKNVHSENYTWDEPDCTLISINDIFLDAFPIEDWLKKYKEYFMTKEDYIKFIESDEFDKRLEHAYLSDGEYGYYPVSKYTANWIEKQPFKYVVRYD